MGIAGDGVGQGLAGGPGHRGGAARPGEGEAAYERIKVRAVGQRQQGLVAEGGRGGAVEEIGHVPFATRLLELDARLVWHAGGQVEGLVNLGREGVEEFVVHHPFALAR